MLGGMGSALGCRTETCYSTRWGKFGGTRIIYEEFLFEAEVMVVIGLTTAMQKGSEFLGNS